MIPSGEEVSPKRKASKRKAKMPADTVAAVSNAQPTPSALCLSDIYSPRCAEIALSMRSRGATDAELCEALGISTETLAIWQGQSKEFAQACADNEAAVVRRLRGNLYKLANGYIRTEQRITAENGNLKVVTTKVEVPPDLEANKYLLSKQQAVETDLAALIRQMGEMRTHRIRPVPLRPGEEKTLEDWPK